MTVYMASRDDRSRSLINADMATAMQRIQQDSALKKVRDYDDSVQEALEDGLSPNGRETLHEIAGDTPATIKLFDEHLKRLADVAITGDPQQSASALTSLRARFSNLSHSSMIRKNLFALYSSIISHLNLKAKSVKGSRLLIKEYPLFYERFTDFYIAQLIDNPIESGMIRPLLDMLANYVIVTGEPPQLVQGKLNVLLESGRGDLEPVVRKILKEHAMGLLPTDSTMLADYVPVLFRLFINALPDERLKRMMQFVNAADLLFARFKVSLSPELLAEWVAFMKTHFFSWKEVQTNAKFLEHAKYLREHGRSVEPFDPDVRAHYRAQTVAANVERPSAVLIKKKATGTAPAPPPAHRYVLIPQVGEPAGPSGWVNLYETVIGNLGVVARWLLLRRGQARGAVSREEANFARARIDENLRNLHVNTEHA